MHGIMIDPRITDELVRRLSTLRGRESRTTNKSAEDVKFLGDQQRQHYGMSV